MTRSLALALLLTLLSVANASKPHLRELLSLVDTPSTAHRQLQATCAIQQGIDFPGNDIGNVPNRPASACCNECEQKGSACGAWTWTSWNGGTCWLKSKKGQQATNSAAQSAELSAPPPTCSINSNTDFVDNDLANVRAAPAGACCNICKNWGGCNAFSWTNLNGGTCWLKTKKGSTRGDSNVQSAEVAGLAACTLEQGIDYIDNDIANVAGFSNPAGCCGLCQNWSGCRAYSWTALNGGTCWLKSKKGATRNDPNVVSSSVLPNLPSSCVQTQQDTDYVNNDIANVQEPDADKCCDICKNWGGGGVCKAFSWSSHNTGTCWLKSAKGQTSGKAGVISGTV